MSWFLKNTAYKNAVAYLFKRGTLHKYVASFYIFLFPDTLGVSKEVLDDLWKSRHPSLRKWNNMGAVMELVMHRDHNYGGEVNYCKEVLECTWAKHLI